MKDECKVAAAVIAGYYLGRHHKLRLAATLAMAMLAKRLKAGGVGGLLQQGTKLLGGASPELGKITERVRGDLLEIGKAAAVNATSKQIDSLSDRLHQRAESLRTATAAAGQAGEQAGAVAGEAAGRAGEAAGRVGEVAGKVGSRIPKQRAKSPTRPEPEEDFENEYEDEYEDDETPYDDEYEEPEETEPEEKPRRRPQRPAKPVTRARR
ncbi:hypothetical protein [Planotetraspora mira]|jgi:hypothetical protein|uniref:Histone protein n=1 Tax=Planotetraspora mira TaxID=58121 RepID=A0A8J3TXU5_9ACTN|nr:hypothetical protein [Planotetraspora mira]GII34524.1 hypothetical protein Pmi06nite_79660 [Planotetraspora mira]